MSHHPHLLTALCVPLRAAPASAAVTPAETIQAVVVARVDGSNARPAGFEFLEALALDSAGRLYALDRCAYALDAFDAAGRHRWSRGRKGNRLWAMRSHVEGQRGTMFDVFDADGRYERSVVVPALLRTFPLLVVRGNRIAGVERDADGAQTVVIARVPWKWAFSLITKLTS